MMCLIMSQPMNLKQLGEISLSGSLGVGFGKTLPASYLGAARQLAFGIRPLVAGGDECIAALQFICGQVVENALKAFLVANGTTEKALTDKEHRHDLSWLWQESQSKLGLADPPPNWLISLSQLHGKPYRIRYAKGVDLLFSPAAEPMAHDVEELITTVTRALGR